MKPAFLNLLAAVVLFFGAGCSTFKLDWDAARALPATPKDLSGRWEGKWTSEATGHADQLRCLITKTGDLQYLAQFHARYKRGLSFTFEYAVPLVAAETEPGHWKFSGDAELGWYAGGAYHYEGMATATNFFSFYSCKYDHGKFELTRPK